jgi:hypothetical protein
VSGGLKLTSKLRLMLRLRTRGVRRPVPPYFFVAWCVIRMIVGSAAMLRQVGPHVADWAVLPHNQMQCLLLMVMVNIRGVPVHSMTGTVGSRWIAALILNLCAR